MRPLGQIRDDLVEAGLTVVAAAPEGRDRADVDLEAGEAIRRRYDELPADEQEAIRLHLAVPEDDAADDELGLRLVDLVRQREADGT